MNDSLHAFSFFITAHSLPQLFLNPFPHTNILFNLSITTKDSDCTVNRSVTKSTAVMARNCEMAQSKQQIQSSNDAEQDIEEQELGIQLGTLPHELALNITEALLPLPSIADAVSACCIEDYFVERDRMRRMIKQSNQLGVSLHDYRASVADESMHPITFLWERPLSKWANPLGICRTYISGGTYMHSILLKRPSHMLSKHLSAIRCVNINADTSTRDRATDIRPKAK